MITHSTPAKKHAETANAQTTTNNLTFNFLDLNLHSAHSQLRKQVCEDGISMRLVPGKGFKILSSKKQDDPLLNYQLGSSLGNGANGQVLRCEKQGHAFALKTGEHQGDPQKFKGYHREAQFHLKMTQLLPQHTTPIHKVFITPMHFHFLMAEGSKNLELLARNGNIPPKDVPAITLKLHKILSDMSTIAISHNDVQLRNFLGEPGSSQASSDWQLKVIDFGAATNEQESDAEVLNSALILFKALTNELNLRSISTKWPFGKEGLETLQALKRISRNAKFNDSSWLAEIKALAPTPEPEKTELDLNSKTRQRT